MLKDNNLEISKFGVIALFMSGLMVILDQLSKWAVMEYILRIDKPLSLCDWFKLDSEIVANSYEAFRAINLAPSLNFVMVWNKGISFGMFSNSNAALILSIVSIVISLGLAGWMIFSKDKYLIISLSLIVGGAIGNVIDRIRLGAVIDFIDVYIGQYHWPAFNFADSCIVVGAIFMLFITIKNDEGIIEDENK